MQSLIEDGSMFDNTFDLLGQKVIFKSVYLNYLFEYF